MQIPTTAKKRLDVTEFAKDKYGLLKDYELKIIKNKKLLFFILSVLMGLILLSAAIYVSVNTNYQLTNDSDAIIYPYLFKHFTLNNIILPGHHSNVLLFPLYLIQGLLPYNYATFSAVTISLTIVTIALWTFFTTFIVGKKYFPVVCASLTLFLIASPTLVSSMTGNTIRNIEYPIGLAFLLSIAWIIKDRLKTWQKIVAVLSSILLCLALAGDELVLFCFIIPIILSIILYILKGHKINRRLFLSLSLVGGVFLFSFILNDLIQHVGIADYYYAAVFSPHTVPLNELSFSFTTATRQLLKLTGANIFGLPKISSGTIILFVNFALLASAVMGFCILLKQSLFDRKKENFEVKDLILVALAISFFLIFGVYILSGQVVHLTPSGTLVSSSQFRYMSLMPLLAIIGIVYLFKQLFKRLDLLIVGFSILSIIIMGISLPYISKNESSLNNKTANARNVINEIINTSAHNHVNFLLTGYWYGATTRFWSNDTVKTASVAQCNVASPTFNTSLSWYKPLTTVTRSALVIDRSGPDIGYWLGCSSNQIKAIYGKPAKIVYLNGVNANNTPVKNSIEYWIYNYNVMSKVNSSDLINI